ncbi:MAG TPA: hypothetical protein VG245_09395 [Candidatus Dormibacteraeota bacterium]|jgi:photosystem II stability/assembly factor-like uncharacterized protein|nr:hypothetical protein [Candidatus Dormibacteraeota bacterium]
MNDELDPTANPDLDRLDARLREAVAEPYDDYVLRRARSRVAGSLAAGGGRRRGVVIALAALIPAAAAAVLLATVLGNLGRPLATHVVTGPTPTVEASPSPAEPSPSAPPSAAPSPSPGAASAGPVSAIAMFDAQDGWGYVPTTATAPSGVVHTTDGGVHWALAHVPTAGRIVLTDPTGVRTAWVLAALPGAGTGGPAAQVQALTTTDQGANWTPGTALSISGGVATLSAIDANRAWLSVTGNGAAGSNAMQLYRTLDGGMHWDLIAKGNPGDSSTGPGYLPGSCQKLGVTFANASDGYLNLHCPGGEYFLYASHDGGVTWAAQHLPLADLTTGYVSNCDCQTAAPVFHGADGFLVLTGGVEAGPLDTLYLTHDSGRTWAGHALPGTPVAPPAMPGAMSTGYVVAVPAGGGTPPPAGTFYHSADGGRTWQRAAGQLDGLGTLDFLTDGLGWYVQQPQGGIPARILRTPDGGRTWVDLRYTVQG